MKLFRFEYYGGTFSLLFIKGKKYYEVNSHYEDRFDDGPKSEVIKYGTFL